MPIVRTSRIDDLDARIEDETIAMLLSRLAERPRRDNGGVFEFTPDTSPEDAQRSVERVLDETLSGWSTWLAVSVS